MNLLQKQNVFGRIFDKYFMISFKDFLKTQEQWIPVQWAKWSNYDDDRGNDEKNSVGRSKYQTDARPRPPGGDQNKFNPEKIFKMKKS